MAKHRMKTEKEKEEEEEETECLSVWEKCILPHAAIVSPANNMRDKFPKVLTKSKALSGFKSCLQGVLSLFLFMKPIPPTNFSLDKKPSLKNASRAAKQKNPPSANTPGLATE